MFKLFNIFLLVVRLTASDGYMVLNSTEQNKISSSSYSCITCKDKWTCDNGSNKSFPDKGCYCDNLCGVMNDCCSNFNLDDRKIAGRFNKSMFECKILSEITKNYDYGVRMVDKCPSKWKDEEIKKLCEDSEVHDKNSRWIDSSLDIPLHDLMPVIDTLTGVMYKNPFCAYCHGDIDDPLEWQSQIYDEIKHSEEKKPYPMHGLTKGKMHHLVNEPYYRICWTALEPDYCPPRATMEDKDGCSHGEFAAFWDNSGNLYRNIHCAKCNKMSCDELQCENPDISDISDLIRPGVGLETLLNPKPKESEIMASKNRTIGTPSDSALYDYLTTVCLIISVCSLVLTILTFLIFARLRARSGKIKLCLMISLLLAQVFFLALDSAKKGNTLTCKIFAAITHYLLLVTFCWINVLALDICKTVSKQRAMQITVTKRKMLLYCLFAFGAPFLVVSASSLLELLEVDTPYNPKYGTGAHCWLSSKESILLFFLGPLGACKLFDLAVFIITVVNILRAKKRASEYGQRHGRSTCSILIFIKLSLIMGLSWIIAFIADEADNKFVWILFIVLNSLQGLFIFLCFCCNRTVLYLWRSECSHVNSYMRAPGFRSSTTSTYTSRSQSRSHSGKPAAV